MARTFEKLILFFVTALVLYCLIYIEYSKFNNLCPYRATSILCLGIHDCQYNYENAENPTVGADFRYYCAHKDLKYTSPFFDESKSEALHGQYDEGEQAKERYRGGGMFGRRFMQEVQPVVSDPTAPYSDGGLSIAPAPPINGPATTQTMACQRWSLVH